MLQVGKTSVFSISEAVFLVKLDIFKGGNLPHSVNKHCFPEGPSDRTEMNKTKKSSFGCMRKLKCPQKKNTKTCGSKFGLKSRYFSSSYCNTVCIIHTHTSRTIQLSHNVIRFIKYAHIQNDTVLLNIIH